MKKIVFNSWPGAFFNPGGGEVQLLESKNELIKIGYSVKMFNQWQPSIDCDIYHQFSIELGTECVLKEYKKKGKKIVISPIMWNLFPKNSFRWNLTKEVFNLADLIMTNSLAESQRLSEDFGIPEKKFYKTRNSISADYLNSSTSEDFKKKFNIDGDFILTVANIDERKNTTNCGRKNLMPQQIVVTLTPLPSSTELLRAVD